MKRALSRLILIDNSAKWALSGLNLGQNLTKWALSGFKSGQVGTIRVHPVQGWIWFDKWPYGVGRVYIVEKSAHIVWEW